MPLQGGRSFDEMVEHIKRTQNVSDESARKIVGSIEQKIKKGKMKLKLMQLQAQLTPEQQVEIDRRINEESRNLPRKPRPRRNINRSVKKKEPPKITPPGRPLKITGGMLRRRNYLHMGGVNTPFKKNEINRELDKDTAGNKYEQDLFDAINEATGGGHERAISEGFKKLKKNKNGTYGFSFKTSKDNHHYIHWYNSPLVKYASMSLVEENGKFAKYWLLNAKDVNGNGWGVVPNSIEKNIRGFINRTFVITARKWIQDSAYGDVYDHPHIPTNNVEAILKHQEHYRVGNIIDVHERDGEWFAIIERDPKYAHLHLPAFCSPAIYQLDALEHESSLSKWLPLHLAGLDENPAYGARIAILRGSCDGPKGQCIHQLKEAKLMKSAYYFNEGDDVESKAFGKPGINRKKLEERLHPLHKKEIAGYDEEFAEGIPPVRVESFSKYPEKKKTEEVDEEGAPVYEPINAERGSVFDLDDNLTSPLGEKIEEDRLNRRLKKERGYEESFGELFMRKFGPKGLRKENPESINRKIGTISLENARKLAKAKLQLLDMSTKTAITLKKGEVEDVKRGIGRMLRVKNPSRLERETFDRFWANDSDAARQLGVLGRTRDDEKFSAEDEEDYREALIPVLNAEHDFERDQADIDVSKAINPDRPHDVYERIKKIREGKIKLLKMKLAAIFDEDVENEQPRVRKKTQGPRPQNRIDPVKLKEKLRTANYHGLREQFTKPTAKTPHEFDPKQHFTHVRNILEPEGEDECTICGKPSKEHKGWKNTPSTRKPALLKNYNFDTGKYNKLAILEPGTTFQEEKKVKKKKELFPDKRKVAQRAGFPKLADVKINPEHGRIIADAYDNMKHEPNNPEVKEAYGALIKETMQQYDDLLKGGLKVTKVTDESNAYKNSAEMHRDVLENNHLNYFPTEAGYGGGNEKKDHPMLQPTKYKDPEGKPMLANDVFRVVHDVNGHVRGEPSGFGPRGEQQAYLTHKQMYSHTANKALFTETAGQNNWVNFNRRSGEKNRKDPRNTEYAEQKAGLLPPNIIYGKWHR